MNISRIFIPLEYVLVFFLGLFAGVIAVSGFMVSSMSSAETVVSYEEVKAREIVRQTVEETAKKDAPEYGFSYEASEDFDYDAPAFAASMPVDTKETWLNWMQEHRDESLEFLNQRWELAQSFVKSGELKRVEDLRAFLLTPREHFVRKANKGKEYADTWLPIGYGATITDPDVVSMMTTTLNIQPDDKVLEIGTGSGYQSAILSNLTKHVYTIEIIKPLYVETHNLYMSLSDKYPNYKNISRKLGDGYYGWEKHAPFDKIIITCGIDHIPPVLLKQLKVGGIMVLPLGPPGRQYIMEIKKKQDENGNIVLTRRDVYNGLSVRFIPFRDEKGQAYYQSTGDDNQKE